MDVRGKVVLVTGASGFLGSHLVPLLTRKGAEVLCPSRSRLDLLVPGNILPYLLKKKPELVIHLAARVGGIGANQKEPGRFFRENLKMGLDLVEACRFYREAGKTLERLIVVGTTCSYPKFPPRIPFREEDLWNGYPEETNAPYGIAKKALITMLQSYRQEYDFPGVNLILANLYGPGDHDDPETSHVIPGLIRKIIEAKSAGRALEVWGTGSATREFLYVEDACEGILAGMDCMVTEPINLPGKGEISIRALVEMLCSILDFTGKITWDSSRPDGQPRRSLDGSRARDMLGWEPKTGLLDGLSRTVEAMLSSSR